VSGWQEVGDRVFVRRYAFYDQNIGVVLGDDSCLVVDTRSTHGQADEVRADLRKLTPLPVSLVVNTHGHYDHAFGNHRFRPAEIVGHEGCVRFLAETGEAQRTIVAANVPAIATEIAEVVIDPPDRTFRERLVVEVSGRPVELRVELRYLGRGHTDHDIVLVVEGRDGPIVFAGDLLENGATPYFGDGFPLDWPNTAQGLVALIADGVVVPGHGDVADRRFAEQQLEGFRGIAALAHEVHAGERSLDDAIERSPFPPADSREPLERALAQLRGELDGSR
jgi:glyoxylase-like metal-dependent hydrolase (beta-lactamase superfamily II)